MPNAEPWPTEDAATKAVDAAARRAWEVDVAKRRTVFPPGMKFPDFDDLEPTQKLEIRNAVLPLVWAALTALPDPRYAAFEQGAEAGQAWGANYAENPYPSGL